MDVTPALETATRPASRLRGWVTDHALATYVVLAYALSWASWVPLAVAGRPVEPGIGRPSHLSGLAGPAVAAVVVTAVLAGPTGLKDLARRLTRWRVGWWWMSVAGVLLAGAIGVTLTGGVEGVADLTRYNGVGAGMGALATVALVLVVNGVGEEVGWRGFLAHRLLARHSLTVAALIVAAAWAPWHAPLFFLVGSFEGFTAAQLAGWVIGLTAGSFVLTWLYRGSGASILLVATWHTAYNFTSATPAATGTVAAITSTAVMVAAVAVGANDLVRRRRA